jgi:hypothetical protein
MAALRGDSLWEVETARELAKSARQHLTAPTVWSRNIGNQGETLNRTEVRGFIALASMCIHVPTWYLYRA